MYVLMIIIYLLSTVDAIDDKKLHNICTVIFGTDRHTHKASTLTLPTQCAAKLMIVMILLISQ